MPSLASTARRFEIDLAVVERGSGTLRGVVAETNQQSQDSRVFSPPRRVLRVRHPSPAKPGMVVRSPDGEMFIVAEHGGSEVAEGVLWHSFKLFRATHRVQWEGRTQRTDPITTLPIEGPIEDKGRIWVAIEPAAREGIERHMHVALEEAVFVSGAAVGRDDRLDGRPVIRVDDTLGVKIGMLR